MKVKVWNEAVIIPTYEVGLPEKNPVFIEKRVYQGSSGSVYPYPVIEKIADEKTDKTYNAIYLENDYVKIMILPELGGRVQMAFDKTKNRHFIYYNQVIKPALVGLTGPWISGGIEFNWPQHHRPSTFDAVDFSFEENEDGSATIWCSEVERMFRTRGMIGFTLYPDKNYLEIKGKLYNRTPFPQTFLWWANPAVKVNDDYQSVFPPDVNAVFDHGKRDVSSFPIAKGTYYKVDYSPGTDISRYKNIPVPTSYMAGVSKYDFVGGYENDSKGGLLHVASHHISPGKKQWTWGNGDFGKAWDRNLTDEDGPYIELMCGVYTDNQPDFSWIMPGEYKDFVQYYMPYRDLGMVKNATKNGMVNLDREGNKLIVKAYTTGVYTGCKVLVKDGDRILLNDSYDAAPTCSYQKELEFNNDVSQLQIELLDDKGHIIVAWKWEGENETEIPEPAKPARKPAEIENNEQLFLTGLHLEQYRHATYNPVDYYQEALRRDSGDVRCNNALGLLKLRKGQFTAAEAYFKSAVETLTARNPNPYDGEPYFNLGLALKFQGKVADAYDAFYKSIWNAAMQNQGYFYLAQLDVIKGDFEVALEHIGKSIAKNTNDQKALHLKVAILRKLGQDKKAMTLVEQILTEDHFNFGVLFEKYLLSKSANDLESLHQTIRKNVHNYIEYALDYAAGGLFDEAIELLQSGISQLNGTVIYPMAFYYLAWFQDRNGAVETGRNSYKLASSANPEYCFPNQVEAVLALEYAIAQNPDDAKARYYLGNFYYAAKEYELAIANWQSSIAIDGYFATVQRNLALATYNKLANAEQALKLLENAFTLDKSDSRVLMELDQLYKRMNFDLAFRQAFLEEHFDLVQQRDDVYLEYITLLNLKGAYQQALDLLNKRIFHPWEGGEGKVAIQYVTALVEIAKQAIQEEEYDLAIGYLQAATVYPHNLAEGKLPGAQENDIYYWLGIALDKSGRGSAAQQDWQLAVQGSSEPAAAIFYNDQQPDKIFYQGLALISLGQKEEAKARFVKLVNYGKNHLNDEVSIDYFAVSLPDLTIWEDDLQKRNQLHCLYMEGLGHLGLGERGNALKCFEQVLALDKAHLGARLHLNLVELLSLQE